MDMPRLTRSDMRHRITCIFFLCTSFLVFTGCVGQTSSLTPASSPLPGGVRGTVQAYGSNCQYSLFGLVPLTTPLNTQEALSEAKEDSGCPVLTDVTVDSYTFFAVLYGGRCVEVRGLGVPAHRTGERLGEYDKITEKPVTQR